VKQFALAIAALLVLSALLAVPVPAQVVNAVLGGTVSDPSGAFIAKVAVTATNVNTGLPRQEKPIRLAVMSSRVFSRAPIRSRRRLLDFRP
jgi:hypothetical protein